MARNKRTAHQIQRDRVEINALALKKVPQLTIAKMFGLSQPMIAYELRVIRRQWQANTVMDLEQARVREVQLLVLVEREAWDCWHRTRRDGAGGDLRYLATILRASGQRTRLLGLFESPPDESSQGQSADLTQAKQARLARIERLYESHLRRKIESEGIHLQQTSAPPPAQCAPAPSGPAPTASPV